MEVEVDDGSVTQQIAFDHRGFFAGDGYAFRVLVDYHQIVSALVGLIAFELERLCGNIELDQTRLKRQRHEVVGTGQPNEIRGMVWKKSESHQSCVDTTALLTDANDVASGKGSLVEGLLDCVDRALWHDLSGCKRWVGVVEREVIDISELIFNTGLNSNHADCLGECTQEQHMPGMMCLEPEVGERNRLQLSHFGGTRRVRMSDATSTNLMLTGSHVLV